MSSDRPPFILDHLVRPNIRQLQPYSSARDEFTGQAEVYIDANENPYDTGLNRYPDPRATALRQRIAARYALSPDQLVLGNGSDEIIDLTLRIFCEPGQDDMIALPPTYGMYRVAADINRVTVREVLLTSDFQPDVAATLAAVQPTTKLLWLCTPNNPSGNDFEPERVRALIAAFPGIVVIDEAYVDFSGRPSYVQWLRQHPNLVIMQTFSKAWGLAGIRLGMAFASFDIINYYNRTKPPYNVNNLTQAAALTALDQPERLHAQVAEITTQRAWLAQRLSTIAGVEHVFPSAANFLLVRVAEPTRLYQYLTDCSIIVRDRSRQPHCRGCLRFTVGTPAENERLIAALQEFDG